MYPYCPHRSEIDLDFYFHTSFLKSFCSNGQVVMRRLFIFQLIKLMSSPGHIAIGCQLGTGILFEDQLHYSREVQMIQWFLGIFFPFQQIRRFFLRTSIHHNCKLQMVLWLWMWFYILHITANYQVLCLTVIRLNIRSDREIMKPWDIHRWLKFVIAKSWYRFYWLLFSYLSHVFSLVCQINHFKSQEMREVIFWELAILTLFLKVDKFKRFIFTFFNQ